MFSQEKIKPTLIIGGAGIATGFGMKLLLDAGAKSRNNTGFLNALNHLSINIFSQVSEKTGTKESNLAAVAASAAAMVIAAGAYYLASNNKPVAADKKSSVEDHQTRADQSSVSGGILGAPQGSAFVKGGSSQAANDSMSAAIISGDALTAFYDRQKLVAGSRPANTAVSNVGLGHTN